MLVMKDGIYKALILSSNVDKKPVRNRVFDCHSKTLFSAIFDLPSLNIKSHVLIQRRRLHLKNHNNEKGTGVRTPPEKSQKYSVS